MIDQSPPVLLVLNAGSSNLKFSLYDAAVPVEAERCLGRGSVEASKGMQRLVFLGSGDEQERQAEWPGDHATSIDDTLSRLMAWIAEAVGCDIVAAAHRVVHGGDCTEMAMIVTPALMSEMQALSAVAPLHQPKCLAPINHLARERPGLPQFVCFDTVFHRTLDALESRFGLPRTLTDQGLRRYGFHGLSYEYIAGRLIDHDPYAAHGRTIVAHLGNGASLCGLVNRTSRATTMGFSTLDGLLMGTRPGRLDPGILLYLMRERHMSAKGLENLLYHHCGLLGVSGGISSDLRELAASAAPQAAEAIALFERYVVKEIGAVAAALGGLDALVFTGGVGEHASDVRNAILDGCRWLGLERDCDGRQAGTNCLSHPGSAVTAWVIPTDENAVIARHTLRRLHQAA
ncbi:acetate/propionate family kinase [Pseudomonas sp. 21LCFQ010]|uniref:acetate/propionate family kinase n=1 Tax=Pseudomonas sp. 21LCFQ010 TaxID=2957506 RepID=UPI002097DA11|nr:acetate/propionate family kinase [Pseudomonas sp. 21LCFQ010]MCO8165986.1 acetate/propionate family kinase [Pseudomonas sp. 21LCFQ010]